MLILYLFWFIALMLLSSEANGAHFLSNLCTDTKIGTYPYPGVDNVYLECEYGNATIYACPSGTNFDPIFMVCSEKKIPYERNNCFHNGVYLPHPFDCKKYIKCENFQIKIFNCRIPMVYSIDTSRCEYRRIVPACKLELADNILRNDLNTHIHYSINEIIAKKRDILHELSDLDKDVDEELDELNATSPQSSNKLNELTLENEIHDDDSSSSEHNSPKQIIINLPDTIPRRKKKNYTKINKNDTLSIQELGLILRILDAPFNVVINAKTDSTDADLALLESFKNWLQPVFATYPEDQRNKTSTENINLLLRTNISNPNVNAFESVTTGSILNSNEVHKFPDNVEIENTDFNTNTPTAEMTDNTIVLEQHSDTSMLPSAPFMSTSKRAETTLRYSNNNEMTDKVNSVLSQRISTSFLGTTSNNISDIVNMDVHNTIDERVEEIKSVKPDIIDEATSSTENIEEVENIHVNDFVLAKVENPIVPVLMTEASTLASVYSSKTLSTRIIIDYDHDNVLIDQDYSKIRNFFDFNNKEKSVSNSIESRSLDSGIDILEDTELNADSVLKVTDTEFDVSDYTKVEDETKMNKNFESATSPLLTFGTESTKLKEVDVFSENTESTPVTTQHVEVTSSTFMVNEVSEKIEKNTDVSILQTNIPEVEISIPLLPISRSVSEVTKINVDAIDHRTTQSVAPFSEETTSVPIVQKFNTETLMVSQNIIVTTESGKTDSTSIKPEHISTTNSHKNDETLGITQDIAATIVSKTVSTSSKPEYISTTDNQKNDKISVTPERISSFVENQINEEESTLSNDNLLINRNDITNQKISDEPKIPNKEAISLLNIDLETAQAGESNNDTIRPSRFIETTNLTEIKNYSPFVYTWHDARRRKNIIVSRQRLRLSGTDKVCYGFVEVQKDDIWRGVCQSTEWTRAEADIICRELGYQKGAKVAWKGHLYQVKMPAWNSTLSIQCHGDEEWVDRCTFQDETECDLKRNAVGVECMLDDVTNL